MSRSVVLSLFLALGLLAMQRTEVSATPTTPSCFDGALGQSFPATKWLDAPGTLVGTSGRDVLVGSEGSDVIDGKGGNDLICSQSTNGPELVLPDTLKGGSGNDHIFGVGSIDGGSGSDLIHVYDAGSYAKGGSGNDVIKVNNGASADGGSGNDDIELEYYEAGELLGGTGNDKIDANSYAVDLIDCGSGQDQYYEVNATQVVRCEKRLLPS